ncbi:hypothetical protein EXIGLDRAFT_672376 [Exidia glandulosa HHB12029]|uniref:Uncharacterized protein n=1 Tax=Exidia glandulosa HHB12029 TaxID=1314781 RepID=A0A165JQC5_EXIGL|nr:hypothetical protein EXIGLDRAFT_672376 [Exidia glandulosa HHB12029]
MFSSGVPPVQRPPSASPILIVTAYYPLSKSKHSLYQYNLWLANFLSRITTDVYMFTPPEMEHSLRGLRGNLPIHLNTSFQSIDHIPIISPLRDAFEEQVAKDPEAWKHVPDLYKIWTAKPWFVHEALANVRREQEGRYQYVFWVDAGSMRQPHAFGHWPSIDRVRSVWADAERLSGTAADDLLFIPMEHAPDVSLVRWTEADGPLRSSKDMSEGSLFGGTPKAIEWWYNTYLAYFHHWLDAGFFVGNDQLLMNALFLLYPARFITVWNRDPETAFDAGLSPWYGGLGYCGDPWFAYEFFLASDEERENMTTMWTSEKLRWDFWRPRPKCRAERILPMTDVLRRTFGPNWRPPAPRLQLSP